MTFESVSHPLQHLVSLYQLVRGHNHWRSVHSILYFKWGAKWIRVELGWNGLSIMYEDPQVDEYTQDYYALDIDTTDMFNRLGLLLALGIDEHIRFSPWQCVPMLAGKPIWFNCTSLISWLISGKMVDEPAQLRQLLEVYSE